MRVNTLFCLSFFMKLSFWMKKVCVLMEFSYGAHQVILYNDMLKRQFMICDSNMTLSFHFFSIGQKKYIWTT